MRDKDRAATNRVYREDGLVRLEITLDDGEVYDVGFEPGDADDLGYLLMAIARDRVEDTTDA